LVVITMVLVGYPEKVGTEEVCEDGQVKIVVIFK
jgi:hypothetical protein